MAEHTYKFDVKVELLNKRSVACGHLIVSDMQMTCSGCSGAITRVLEKAKTEDGVSSYSVDLNTQEVIVKGTMPYEDVLAKIQKTGKEVRSGTTID